MKNRFTAKQTGILVCQDDVCETFITFIEWNATADNRRQLFVMFEKEVETLRAASNSGLHL